jgi:hypothetical protein
VRRSFDFLTTPKYHSREPWVGIDSQARLINEPLSDDPLSDEPVAGSGNDNIGIAVCDRGKQAGCSSRP